ncbi:MAG: polysaccharide deacetylase family protein, partial [Anaerovoracaceae bacterium]|nr:polysaccharide deacetylase family protein [Anaerovoracaceae bacterium]
GFKKRAAAMLVITALLIAVSVLIVHMITSAGYRDESSFASYAADYFRNNDMEQSVGRGEQEIRYGKTASTAISLPVLKTGVSNKVIRRASGAEKTMFLEKYRNSRSGGRRACMLTDYSTFNTPYSAVGVVILTKYESTDAGGRNMGVRGTHVTAYNFSTQTGIDVRKERIFKGDYAEAERGLVERALRKKYGSDLKDGWRDKTDPDTFAGKFVLTNTGVRYYFDNASVISSGRDNGVAWCEIKYRDLKGYLRDDIGVCRIDTTKKMVALTFDDGPSRYTGRILDILKKYHAEATFFELGINIDRMPGSGRLLKRELAQDCEIGTHSYSHLYLTSVKRSRALADIEKSRETIKKATGCEPTLFRPPGGVITQDLENSIDLPCILWSVDSRDWANRNVKKTMRNVMAGGDLDGRVVLLHSIYPSTVEAIDKMIPALQKKGYQFVTVSDMIEYRYKDEIVSNKIYGNKYFTFSGKDR